MLDSWQPSNEEVLSHLANLNRALKRNKETAFMEEVTWLYARGISDVFDLEYDEVSDEFSLPKEIRH